MSESKVGANDADAMAHQLKESLSDRRPQPWKLILGALLGSVALLASLAWWLYPRPQPGPLQIIGLDTICTADETPTVRAQLLAAPTDKAPRSLQGHTVIFQELPRIVPGAPKPREVIVKSDEDGRAFAAWPMSEPLSAELLAMHIDPALNKGSPRERCRAFVWPKDAAVLIVDADETLVSDALDAKAEAALIQAEADKWRIVYLSCAAVNAHDFRKSRGWLEKQAKLPRGPVLGRSRFAEDASTESSRIEWVADLRNRFKGSLVALVKTAAAAQACKDAGARTILVGAEAPPAGVVHAPTWSDVPAKLK